MVNDEWIGIQALVLSIGFCVLQKVKQEFSRLLWPSTLGCSMYFSLCMTSNTSHESSEWDDFLLGNHILEVSGSTVQWHFLDSLSRFTGILKVDSQVGASGFGSLGGIIGFNSVATHFTDS